MNAENEKRQELIDANLTWLQEIFDKNLFLKQKVLVHIFERFEFKLKDNQSGCIIAVQETEIT